MIPRTLADQISVTPTSVPDGFNSVFNPGRMGNTANIAYGGCTFGTGVSAAYSTVEPGYHVYSVMGNYLGPALTDRKLLCKVRRIRDTRTFATRIVEVSQDKGDGTTRSCAVLIVDFQVAEFATLLEYTSKSRLEQTDVESTLSISTFREKMIEDGKLTSEMVALQKKVFGLNELFFDMRMPAEGIFAQTLNGIASQNPTTQDHLQLPEKTSSVWNRVRHDLPSEAHQMGALAFFMDGALSFLPLSHSKMFLYDAGACSSLDFGLRILANDIDLTQWHYKEMHTVHGSDGRTYSEARLWNQMGKMVAVVTQQSILRPKATTKAAL